MAYRYGQPVYAEVRGSRWGNPVQRLVGQDGMISSKRLMDAFRAGIAASYPNSSIRKDGQAVNVRLSNGLGLDVVPAFHLFRETALRNITTSRKAGTVTGGF